MKRVFGFNSYELSSWRSFVRLMSSPRDPSSLAAWRIMFGEWWWLLWPWKCISLSNREHRRYFVQDQCFAQTTAFFCASCCFGHPNVRSTVCRQIRTSNVLISAGDTSTTRVTDLPAFGSLTWALSVMITVVFISRDGWSCSPAYEYCFTAKQICVQAPWLAVIPGKICTHPLTAAQQWLLGVFCWERNTSFAPPPPPIATETEWSLSALKKVQ